MKSRVKLQKGNKKLINAWAFYDWANSVYPLVISSQFSPFIIAQYLTKFHTLIFWVINSRILH